MTAYFHAQHAIEHAWKARANLDGSWPWPFSLSGRMKTPVSGVNSTATNQEAVSAIADDREQRKAILAGAARREADRDEPRNSDERAGQHREGGGGVGEGRSSDFVDALLELGDHGLHRDHGVVDEKPQPDDERTERDALQADAGQFHDHEGDGKNQRNGDRHDDAGAPAERQEAHPEDDDDGLDQRLDELAHGLLDDLRLVGHQVGLDADGQIGGHPGEALLDVLAERENVGVLGHRDGKPDGWNAVVAEHRLLRIDVVAADLGDVTQPKEPAIDAEVDGLEAFFRRELAGDADRDLLDIGVDGAAGLDGVLLLQCLHQLGDVEPHGGELLRRELQVDFLVLGAEEVDLRDVRARRAARRARARHSRAARACQSRPKSARRSASRCRRTRR